MPTEAGGREPGDDLARTPPTARRWAVPRLSWPWLVIVVALAVFALLGWQGVSTVARDGPLDAAEYLLNAQYLDAHGHLPPDYVSYEYSAPPLYEVLGVGLERAVRSAPAWPLELPWNAATRLLWLLLVGTSATCLVSRRPRVRVLGVVGLAVGGLWGLDEALALARSQTWSAGQLFSLAAAMAFVVVSALIARELWPGRPLRMLATAGFVIAYPVVLRLGVLFHPETTLSLIAAIATLLVLRAERRGWTLGRGIVVGVFCGLALLTRQSAVVLVACVVTVALLAGGRSAARFTLGVVVATALLAGPWLGYAAATWGNPLQGNLHRPGGLIPGGEPLSYYVSFPVGSLVLHPYRPRLTNELLPQLHADLWSDWFGAFHQPAFEHPSKVDRVTASSQSVLGLAADALAIGGLVVVGVPALIRLVRRKRLGGDDPRFGFLALLAVAAFVGLAAQIVRYPQVGGKEIKASYLMFTAPAWAVFSVAAWIALVRGRPRLKIVLAAAAALYVVSYGTSLAATFTRTYPPLPHPSVPAGYVDLKTSIQQVSPTPGQGGEADFAVFVANQGTGTAQNVVLTIALPAGMKVLGPPSYERGPGCTRSQTIVCPLDFLERGMSTPVRFGVRVGKSGLQVITAAVTSSSVDARPRDNTASLTMTVGPYR
jgi:uncharacterized repeat protein (TIGR01451 family)